VAGPAWQRGHIAPVLRDLNLTLSWTWPAEALTTIRSDEI